MSYIFYTFPKAIFAAVLFLAGTVCACAQQTPNKTSVPATSEQPASTNEAGLTPIGDLHLQPQKIIVPSKFQGVDPNLIVNLPAGYTAKVFYSGGLDRARFMAWGPDSVLYVAVQGTTNPGYVLALPDRDHDGVADTAIKVATSISAHSIAFYKGALYAAEETRVWKFEDVNQDGIYEKKSLFIDNVGFTANDPVGGHYTRTIVFDSANHKVYLSIGSPCNVCRDTARAVIEQYNDDGTGRRFFATGLRNAVGITIHPRTGKLWADNNGSDNQGNDIPPEWIDIVRDGGFYGFPFAYGSGTYFDLTKGDDYKALTPLTRWDSMKVSKMVPPAALIQAHSAPMAIEFTNGGFPQFQHGAFVVLRGSWNRTPATGYKVVYLDFDNDQDTVANSVSDFLTGFQSANGSVWARPVGMELDSQGTMYVGTDAGVQFILSISPTAVSSVKQGSSPELSDGTSLDQNYPNPVSGVTTLGFTLVKGGRAMLSIFDNRGKLVQTVVDKEYSAGTHTVSYDTKGLPTGAYTILLNVAGKTTSNVMNVVH